MVISDKFEVYIIYNTFICSSHKQKKKLGQEIRLNGFFSKFFVTVDNVKLSAIISLGDFIELNWLYGKCVLFVQK